MSKETAESIMRWAGLAFDLTLAAIMYGAAVLLLAFALRFATDGLSATEAAMGIYPSIYTDVQGFLIFPSVVAFVLAYLFKPAKWLLRLYAIGMVALVILIAAQTNRADNFNPVAPPARVEN